MIRYLIGASQIQYDLLNNLFSKIKLHQKQVMFYIDAHSIFYRLYREDGLLSIENYSRDLLVKDLVISFLNVLGHYRRYLITRLHKNNTIIILFNHKLPNYQKTYDNEYCKLLYNRYSPKNEKYAIITSIIEEAYSYICGIIPYIENVYAIDSSVDCDNYSMMASFIQSNNTKDILHVIFSRSQITYQLLINKNIVQLENYRTNSRLLYTDNVFNKGIFDKKDYNIINNIPPQILPLIWSVGGCSDISIKHTKYINGQYRLIKIIDALATKDEINPNMSLTYFLNLIQKELNTKDILDDYDFINNRYKVLNLSLSAKAISSSIREQISAAFYNLYDENGLEAINDLILAVNNNSDLIGLTNLNMNIDTTNEYDGSW